MHLFKSFRESNNKLIQQLEMTYDRFVNEMRITPSFDPQDVAAKCHIVIADLRLSASRAKPTSPLTYDFNHNLSIYAQLNTEQFILLKNLSTIYKTYSMPLKELTKSIGKESLYLGECIKKTIDEFDSDIQHDIDDAEKLILSLKNMNKFFAEPTLKNLKSILTYLKIFNDQTSRSSHRMTTMTIAIRSAVCAAIITICSKMPALTPHRKQWAALSKKLSCHLKIRKHANCHAHYETLLNEITRMLPKASTKTAVQVNQDLAALLHSPADPHPYVI